MSDIGFYTRKGWPLAIIFAVTIAAFYINHNISSDYKDKIVAAEQQLAVIKAEIALSQERADEYFRAREDLRNHLEYMYNKEEPQKLIDRLKSDAAYFGIKLSDIQLNIPRFFKDRDNSLSAVPVGFRASFRGGYFRLERFLKDFERRPYLENIEEIDVGCGSPDGSELRLAVKGTLRVFDKNLVEWCKGDEP